MELKGYMATLYTMSEWFVRITFLSLLWYAFTLLGLVVFGISPATAALFTVVRKWVRKDTEFPILSIFWKTFKMEFVKSNITGLFMFLTGVFFYIDFRLISSAENIIFQILFYCLMIIIILYVMTSLYVFPVYVNYELKVTHLLKNSVLIASTNPLNTVIMLMGFFLIFYMLTLFPTFIVFVGPSLLGILLMWQANQAFEKIDSKVNVLVN